jgi:hypothetical protein
VVSIYSETIIQTKKNSSNKSSLTPSLFIEVTVQSPDSEQSYICVKGFLFCLFLRFYTYSDSVEYLFFILLRRNSVEHRVSITFKEWQHPFLLIVIYRDKYWSFGNLLQTRTKDKKGVQWCLLLIILDQQTVILASHLETFCKHVPKIKRVCNGVNCLLFLINKLSFW